MGETPYLERYLAGDHIKVWQELTLIPPTILYERPLFTDVYSVAQESMRRVRTNLETLKQRWEDAGLAFKYPNEVLGIPANVSEVEALIVDYRDRIGHLPISLHAFWEIVGSVNFCAKDNTFIPPGTDDYYHGSDPLWIDPALPCVASSIWMWDDEDNGVEAPDEVPDHIREGIRVEFAPDSIHKDNMSGGGPLEFLLVSGADCQICFSDYREYDKTISLIEYLRLSLTWASFPGFSLYGKANDPEWAYEEHDQYDQRTPPAILQEIARDLLPF